MKNGKTIQPTSRELNRLKKEYFESRVKKDLEKKYKIPLLTIVRVLEKERCSERVYKILFKQKTN